MGPRASVVVVSTVNAAGLERCLASLAALGPDEPPFETIVVLNGADDGVRAAAARASGVTVVESVVNRGFAGGSNLGRSAASGEFVVLLHDDAEPQDGWLSALVRCAEERPEAGAVGSRVLNPDGTLQLAGAVLWRDASTHSVSGAHGDFPERRAVDYAGSSSLLVRAATWDAVGGMDDELRMEREIKDALIEQLVSEVEALHATINRARRRGRPQPVAPPSRRARLSTAS